ncbi:MAG: histidine phosphatase family protein, partial [Verrucomicrobia bacterium]|nr:histidine phosphatase family protein [Verrucomicrobiota bacterium]
TANIFSKQIQAPVFTSSLLREVCQGEAEGMTWSSIKKKYKRVSSPNWTLLEIAGGETYEQVLSRIESAFSEIHQKYPNEKVLIVTHRLLIKTLSSKFLDPYRTIDLMNCEILPIIYEEKDGKPSITILEKESSTPEGL